MRNIFKQKCFMLQFTELSNVLWFFNSKLSIKTENTGKKLFCRK